MDETVQQLGVLADQPVVGDWDGDGEDDIGLFRNAGVVGGWILGFDRGGLSDQTVDFGLGGDTSAAGNW